MAREEAGYVSANGVNHLSLPVSCDIEWLKGDTYEDQARFACMVAFLEPVFGGTNLGERSPQTAVFEQDTETALWRLDFLNREFAAPWLKEGAQLAIFLGSKCRGVATLRSATSP
ncbi:MAG: hypothetical protein RL499_113 [Actinomycetota bacterium]|jgi:hypothetical protein